MKLMSATPGEGDEITESYVASGVPAWPVYNLQELHFMTYQFHLMTDKFHFMTEPTMSTVRLPPKATAC
jgi:hypothetical protein